MSDPTANAEPQQFTAQFRPHVKGFGFAQVDDGTAVAPRIFIPPPLTRGLLADDRITVTATADEKGFTATHVTVTGRSRRMVSGTIATRAGRLVVKTDPALATSWVRLDDPLTRQLSPHDGQVVVLLLTDEHTELAGRAVVAGPYRDGSPQAVRARTVVSTLGRVTPDSFPAAHANDTAFATLTHLKLTGQLASGGRGSAAERDRAGPVPGDVAGFQERRDDVCVTIDGEHSRDLDDAVGADWDADPASPVQVAVHIVDAGRAIGIGSDADRYAKVAAATTYFVVGENAPMIDPTLSENALSLLPDVDRYVLSVRFQVQPDGSITHPKLETAAIRSRAKLSYRELHDVLQGEPQALRQYPDTTVTTVMPVLTNLIEAAQRLGTTRDTHRLSDLFTDITEEPAIIDGRVTVVDAHSFPDANRVVERLMVAANETVASWLAERHVPALFRSHAGIDPDRIDAVLAAFAQCGLTVTRDDTDDSGSRLIADLIGLLDDPAVDPPVRDLLVQVLAQATARASYSPTPASHVGLNATYYTHFTSPLRRYADLVAHRQVRAVLAGDTPPYGRDELAHLGVWLDARLGVTSQLASAERASLWDHLLARGTVDPDTVGTVTAVVPAGVRLRFATRGTTGFLAAADVTDDPAITRLDVDENGVATRDGQFHLGVELAVTFAGVDHTGRASWRRR